MKNVTIQSVMHNNRRRGFELVADSQTWWFPYSRLQVMPMEGVHVTDVYIDAELANMGFSYVLSTGEEGSVSLDAVRYYNRDPDYMRDLLLHKLTCEALTHLGTCGLSRREIIRRMKTSAAQLYRLLDTTNYRKSVDQMLRLLAVLDCDVDLVVKDRTSS